MASRKKKKGNLNDAVIENRRARHDYDISDTLECGIQLRGTEVKSIRGGRASLAEGWIKADLEPLALTLHGVHVAEYPPAGPRQHEPVRSRVLLAHAREIKKLAIAADGDGATLIPLKVYFKEGRAKVLVGIGQGRRKSDKRQDMAKKEARREMDRAMTSRRI